MIDAYHGKADYPAPGSLAVNPFAPTVQTAARLRGYDRSPGRAKDAAMPFKAMPMCFDHGG
jgi:hypothetical protein